MVLDQESKTLFDLAFCMGTLFCQAFNSGIDGLFLGQAH